MSFWIPKTQVNPAVWITSFGAILIAFNLFNVRRYGEIEFWMATVKVTAIFGIILLGLLLPMNASTATRLLGTDTTNHVLIPCNGSVPCLQQPGFDCFTFNDIPKLITLDWREDPFKQFLVSGIWGRLAGFWLCCCQAVFAFTGPEIIGITANEAERPRETLPKAARRITKRLSVLYIGASFVLGLNLSSNDPQLRYFISNPQTTYQGPFVLMIERAGIPGLAHVVNAVVLIAALSVGNTNLYASVSIDRK